MCGIAGSINFEVDIKKLKKDLYHRGPDEFGKIKYKNCTLFHFRLAIQDIQNGHQPFSIGNYVIVFNGEIYNHLELRKMCRYNFKTRSDTETLLAMYIEYGSKMFDYIDGMFAFAILDKEKNTLFFARDRAGKKPLYFYKKNNIFFFASELNAIKNQFVLDINEDAISSYLRCGFFFSSYTPYKDIIEAKGGYFYELDINSLILKEEKYFFLKKFYEKEKITNKDEALRLLDDALHKSVKDRIESSDLEVGAFLSGGIDSSLIVAIASSYKSKLNTFTVKFSGDYDESYLAKMTAKKYNTNHTEIEIDINLKRDIENILLNYGEPFMDSSAIPSYYVSKEAKKYTTVILNGDGADELFGGYRRYVPIKNNWVRIAKYLSFILPLLPKPHNKKSFYNYIYRLLSFSKKEGIDFYLSATTDVFEDVLTFRKNYIIDEMDKFISSIKLDSLSKILYLDFNILLFSDLLVKMDIATMSNSLEVRSPFLSKYILELAPRLDNSLKIKNSKTKYILRELAKKYLPKTLINQPKRGFEVPLKDWVNNDLKEIIFDSLKKGCYSENFINREFIDKILYKKIDVSEEKRAKMLWAMFCLEVWRKNQ